MLFPKQGKRTFFLMIFPKKNIIILFFNFFNF